MSRIGFASQTDPATVYHMDLAESLEPGDSPRTIN